MAKRKAITGFKINKNQIKKKCADSDAFKKAADWHATRKINKAKRKLLEEYNSHPVTQELEGGASGENISGTLGGYGNLFTFIGFAEGSTPTQAVRAFLTAAIKMKRVPNKATSTVNYTVTVPTLNDFQIAKMPWESDNWVRAVENGVSGFNYFMSKAAASSRSGGGIQINNKLRSLGSSSNISYMTKILNDFKRRIIE